MAFSHSSQKGFSAVGLFFMGLVVIVVMSATGFFTPSKSEVTDKNTYQATGSKQVDKKSNLQFVDVDFSTPTPTQSPTIAPPEVTLPPYIPPPAGGCEPYTPINGCACQSPPYQVWVYCNGKTPNSPNPDCTTFPGGDPDFCNKFAQTHPNCTPYCMGKPVIYLYVEKPTFFDVTVEPQKNIIVSIPEYNNGWKNVLALPGGILKYNNNYYRELFYESTHDTINKPDNGVFLAESDLENELKAQTEKLGLNSFETKEFVDYWVPRLTALHKKYIFFSILSHDEKDRTDHVSIKPAPDVFIQFIAYFEGTDEKFETKPFSYPEVPKRHGITAIEWGGVIGK